MRGITGFALGITLAGFMALACGKPASQDAGPKRYRVSTVRAGIKAAQSPGGFTVETQRYCTNKDGRTLIDVDYSTGGPPLFSRALVIDGDGKRVTDDRGGTLLEPVPPAFVKAHAAYVAQIESLLSSLAENGKAAP